MIANHYVYDGVTGEILRICQGNLRHVEQNANGGIVVSLKKPIYIKHETHYHKNGKIVDRPIITIPMAAKAGMAATVRGAPKGAKIDSGGMGVATRKGSDLELLFDAEGDYEVTITPEFPYAIAKAVIVVSS